LFVLHKYVESFQYSRKAAEVNPKSATAYYYMGYSLHNLGKEYDKSSVTALSEAARLAPGSIQVLYVLGKVERSQGKFADAEKHLVAAKKLATAKIPEIYAELSQLYANDLKKYGEAADELEQYIKASKLSDADEKVARDKVADLRAKAKMQTNN
jgi:lipopolysaccharide biosynthesis regulator YciM